ncbi:TonB-dependent receptor [Rhodoferax sp.]|uniref:TonB-dependent receptor n=1 Tax=Rhodoferax sp. TaxID=50421 RepID=UPI00374D359C
MTCYPLSARLAVLPLALAAAFPWSAQAQTTPMLKETVVTATRFPEAAASLPFGVSVITADEIQASGVNSVNEALMKLLGVPGRLDISGGNNYTLDLRGFGVTADNNQVVIVDGLRLNEADLSSAGISSIPIESVDRIEVLHGSGAVLYGEGATGGVIVITTKAGRGQQRTTSATLYGAVGSHGTRDARANAVIASGGFSVDVSADEHRSDGHRENFASTANGVSVTGQWSNDWLRIGARVGRSDQDSGLPGALSAAQYAADPHQASTPTDHGSVKKDNAGVFAEASLGDWQLAAEANQRTKKYDSTSSSFGPYGYDVDASNYSLRARNAGKLGASDNILVLGFDHGDWTRSMAQSSDQATARSSAVYAKDDFTWAATGTRFSVGARSEDIQKSESASASNLNSRQNAWDLGLSQPVAADVTVYARLGRSYRLANVDEFSYTTPNVPLQAQTSRDMELGARWTLPQGQVDLRVYRSRLQHEIGYDPSGVGPFGPFGANINFDPTRHQGLELESRHTLSAAWDLRVNAALRQATFTEGVYAGKNLALVPKKTVAVRADWRPIAGHTVGAGLNWVGSQNPDFANACTMPSYTTIDLRYAYQFGAAELALGVANAADHKFYTQAYGCVDGVTTSIYPEAGRTVTASLRYKF